jgi:hypothetical protein
MVNFVLYALATIGLTHIIVDGGIFQPVRDAIKLYCWEWLDHLIACYQCVGFWAGLLTGYVLVAHNIGEVIMCGFASSFLAYLAADYLNYLESKNY